MYLHVKLHVPTVSRDVDQSKAAQCRIANAEPVDPKQPCIDSYEHRLSVYRRQLTTSSPVIARCHRHHRDNLVLQCFPDSPMPHCTAYLLDPLRCRFGGPIPRPASGIPSHQPSHFQPPYPYNPATVAAAQHAALLRSPPITFLHPGKPLSDQIRVHRFALHSSFS